MKRYTREEVKEGVKVALLEVGVEIVEISGAIMRVRSTGGQLYEIQTGFWYELKEAE